MLGSTPGNTSSTAHSNVFRAQPEDTRAPAFPQTADLGQPQGAVRDAQGHIWLLGRRGVARVSPDGQGVSVIAGCEHPLFAGGGLAREGGTKVTSGYPGIDPAGNFYFTVHRKAAGDSFPPALYRVRPGATEAELFSNAPPDGAP
ncbi:hypothetical protein [Hyalangium versicolor]|uniref:hypothetical protein n=1 Tax=Hyalangium versicolor TaxID=2861190 RepID=UPI001CCFDE31|nr:hypothetical protein [Hyalangium versicolor]